jgi:hypothetical protein
MPITSKIVSYNPAHGEMYSIQHIVINLSATCNRSVVFSEYFGFLRVLLFSPSTLVFSEYFCFLRVLWFSPSTLVFSEYFGFLRVLWFSASIKLTTMHDIAEILLKVSLNTITRQIWNDYTDFSGQKRDKLIFCSCERSLFQGKNEYTPLPQKI